MTGEQQRVLARLREGPAALAGIGAAFADDRASARALPSMGHADPLGVLVTTWRTGWR